MANNITTIQQSLEKEFSNCKVIYSKIEDNDEDERDYCVVLIKKNIAKVVASFSLTSKCDLAYNVNFIDLNIYEAQDLIRTLQTILED